MRSAQSATCALLAISLLLSAPDTARGQHAGHGAIGGTAGVDSTPPSRWHVMAQAIPVLTHAAHTAGGATLTEAYLSQPVLMIKRAWWADRVQLESTLDGEGVSLRRGELSTGAFGEGFADRRHPHTYLHELVLTGSDSIGALAYSASVGRGFAPFGTDDPMMRPFEKYPINHHLAQILERGFVAGAVRMGPAMLEAATFGGEEPSSPRSLPLASRLGDSWSARATTFLWSGAELQASYARVASPEQPSGEGLDQRKQSVSGRIVSAGGERYLLAEWGRTVERDHARDVGVFAYETALVEGSLLLGRVGLAARLEQTGRPEEERLTDPFRTARPASELAISGITRWRAATVAVTLPTATRGPVQGYPYLELERLTVRSEDARTVFAPERFYGRQAPWMVSAGVRVRFGALHARMGRYGVAEVPGAPLGVLGVPASASHTHRH